MEEVIGRESELAQLEELVSSLADGPRALVLSGGPGIGKTTLWRAGVEAAGAQSARVLVARPAEAEAKFSFAALGDLLYPALGDVLPGLPAPQRRALEVALLLDEGDEAVDPRTLGVAVLNGLRMCAGEGPVVLAIDDVQWLDAGSERILRFVVRRLGSVPVALLVCERVSAPGPVPLGLDGALGAERIVAITVGGLTVGALQKILYDRLGSALPRPLSLRLHEASAGNPFFALEIARELGRESVSLAPGEPLPIPGSLDELVRGRVVSLPGATRSTLLAAAALTEPTCALVEAATGEGVHARLAPAQEAGVVTLDDDRIRFTHPLLASSVYQAAPSAERRAMHARLAEVVASVEERARHLALGADGHDAAAAADLDLAAVQAAGRGAPAVAAALYEHAARLTPPDERDRKRSRLVDAAEQLRAAGEFPGTRALLEPLLPELDEGPERARALFVLAWTAASWEDARELCRQALAGAEDDELRARIHHWLSLVWMLQGDVRQAREHARRAVEIAEEAQDPVSLCRAHGLLVLTSMLVGEPVAEAEVERTRVFEHESREAPTFYTPSLAHAALLVYRDRHDEARRALEEGLRIVAERGDEEMVVVVTYHLGQLELRAGRWELAAEHAARAYELSESFESPVRRGTFRYLQGTVAAHLGLAVEARGFLDEAAALTKAFGDMYFAIETDTSLGFLDASLGDLEGARDRLAPLPARLLEMGYREPALFQSIPSLAEALVGLGEVDEADPHIDLLEQLARAVGSPLALAQAARCRALVAGARGDLDTALDVAAESLAHHARAPVPFERGRTLVALGAVLRRARQKARAREALTEALAIFDALGAGLWAKRARAELARIGGRRAGTAALTPSERQLAELIAQGRSNREAAVSLYVTPKTVETKLSRIYAKLGINSRTQLARWLAEDGREPNV